MEQKLIIVMVALALTGCGEQTVGANAGRIMLGVSTLGISELAIQRSKEEKATIKAQCAEFKGMDNVKCVSLLTSPPEPERARVIVDNPARQNNEMHCTTMGIGGGMASTNCM